MAWACALAAVVAIGALAAPSRAAGPPTSPAAPDPSFVFQPFVTTKANGMGLGLAVCRTIITAHGGRLSAARADGGGALFLIDLPAAAPAAAEPQPASPA